MGHMPQRLDNGRFKSELEGKKKSALFRIRETTLDGLKGLCAQLGKPMSVVIDELVEQMLMANEALYASDKIGSNTVNQGSRELVVSLEKTTMKYGNAKLGRFDRRHRGRNW